MQSSLSSLKLHWRAPLQTKGFLRIIEFVSFFVPYVTATRCLLVCEWVGQRKWLVVGGTWPENGGCAKLMQSFDKPLPELQVLTQPPPPPPPPPNLVMQKGEGPLPQKCWMSD